MASLMHLSVLSPRVGGGGRQLTGIDIKGWYLSRDFDVFPMPQGREGK